MKKIFLVAASAFTLLMATPVTHAQSTLLNVSYDVAREFYKDYNASFIDHYKKTTGKDIKIDQSHGGSSAQARAVNDGLAADVVTMNTTTDVDFLAGTGVVSKDWRKEFADNASPTTSTMLFLVRRGNPKKITDWKDLIQPGIKVVVVNPKTGGNGRMAYLAAWGYAKKKGASDAQAAEFLDFGVQGLLVGLERLDQPVDIGNGRRCRDYDRLVFAGQAGNRRNISERHRRGVGQDRTDHDEAADDQRPGDDHRAAQQDMDLVLERQPQHHRRDEGDHPRRPGHQGRRYRTLHSVLRTAQLVCRST